MDEHRLGRNPVPFADSSRLVVIPAGGLAAVGSGYSTYLTYAEYLTELAELVGGLRIYAPIYRADHPEHEYFSQRVLDPELCQVVPLDGHSRRQGGVGLIGNYVRQARVFRRAAASWRRMLVYSPSVTAGLVARALQKLRSAAAVYTYVWGDWAELSPHLPQVGVVRTILNPWQRRWICSQERWLVGRSRTVWVAGTALQQRYEKVGRDVQETIPMIKAAELLAATHAAAPRDPATLLSVGRLAPGKGLETLLGALSTLQRDYPDLNLRLAGSGDREFVEHLVRCATDLGVRERVTLMGVVPNGPALWQEYQRATVFVLPSLSEGFARVLYEAMALGAPIVTTAVGAIPTMLKQAHQAMLVAPGDPAALAAGIRNVMTLDDRGARLAREARRLFEERFAADATTTAQRIARTILRDDQPA